MDKVTKILICAYILNTIILIFVIMFRRDCGKINENFNKKIKEKENLLEVKNGLYQFLLVMSGVFNAYLYVKSFTYPECEESKSSGNF